ncbi:arginase family protein [Falsochrobactrum sp. TDYN1]|uniref:Arginase family protein n=1 Tax=Falsochrobactrum tianjinense TaxID=2706015 RepID=A0A949PLQ4_9HYPH|nr:arginase family protein [Falsochrobactrum sp. TDYN1]MBV2143557.1 arginase family protein [Falsochrobactrum sp. TDYN1]
MPEASPLRQLTSFMGVPHANEPGKAMAVILGLPFDCGNHPTRVGSRLGPSSIREQSLLLRAYDGDTGINPLSSLNLVDLGDADVVSGEIENAYEVIEAAMKIALSNGAVPVIFGGDGAIALPQMRALSKRYDDLCVLHIDAHTDAYPIDGYNNATPFSRAFEEGLVNARRSFHIGTRRSHLVPGVYDYGRQLGYSIISMELMMQMGIPQIFSKVRDTIQDRPVYLCFDMDFFDPSVAPGVCTPAWGGASAREGLEVIRNLSGLNIVAIDINTISPPHDVGGMSAYLAATVAYELLLMLALGTIGRNVVERGQS